MLCVMRCALVENGKVVKESGSAADVPWWSFTKTVLSAAALALVGQGRLELDAHLRNRPYTLRQLLRHTAGLREYGLLPAYHTAVARGDEPWPANELLARVNAGNLLWEPDRGWAYSNVGYLLVRELIEEAEGTALGAALQKLVFSPLRMSGARVALVPKELAGVDMGDARFYHPAWVYHGLVVGPLSDAALFLAALMDGRLLPRDLLAAMCEGRPLGFSDPARPERDWAYGLGLMIGLTEGGERTLGHTGGGPGSVIAVRHKPARGTVSAAFLAGSDEARVERCAIAGAIVQ